MKPYIMNLSFKGINFLLLLVILTINSPLLWAQQSEWKKNQIKFAPLRMINLFTPGAEFSHELNYGRLATQLSAAYLFEPFNINERQSKLNGYKLNLEEKYYFKKLQKSKVRAYVAIEIGYSDAEMMVESPLIPYEYINHSLEASRENIYWDTFKQNRKSKIGNAKFGLQFRKHRFVGDISAGIGILHQNITHSNKKYPMDVDTNTHYEDILSQYFYFEGENYAPNLPISFKIGMGF